MCGIAGVLRFTPGPGPGLADVCRVTRALAHRGPHGEGLREGPGVTLGHRRLAILDLSDAGAQPMTCGQLTLVYNGELYNHADLRAQLAEHHRFTSATDTEVVLAAWQRWGPDALDRFEGMYAFGLFDEGNRRLHLVRDRLGIKPLYYHRSDRWLIFASEVEAMLHCGQVPRLPDMAAWSRQLLCSSTLQVDHEATLLDGVRALPAASCLSLDAEGRTHLRRYWTLPDSSPPPGPVRAGESAAAQLGQLLSGSVYRMRMGDVPVAAFLSGGLDSSAIAAAAAKTGPITALTIVHADPATARAPAGDDDLRYSRILAAAHPDGIEHHVSVQQAALSLADLDAVCDLAALADDPRHVAMLGNYRAVADLGLRVVLNGQGADEVMGGYVGLPAFTAHILDVRHPYAATIAGLPASRQAGSLSGEVLARRADAHAEVLAFHRALPGPPLEAAHRLLVATQLARVVQFEDYLAMRAGVEARFPFLDHRLVEWCFTRAFQDHVDPGARAGKVLLRSAMTASLPPVLLGRPKQVFPHPDPGGLRRSLAVLADRHTSALRSDPLVNRLFDLPPAGHLARLPAATLWLLLMVWRWHIKVQDPASLPSPDHECL